MKLKKERFSDREEPLAKQTLRTAYMLLMVLSVPVLSFWTLFNGYPSDLVTGAIVGASIIAVVEFATD